MSVLQWVGGLDIVEHCVPLGLYTLQPPRGAPLCDVLICNGRGVSLACNVLMGIRLCLIVLM